MADGTAIEWTDATWNPVTGCRIVSPGCSNCYAMKLAGTRLKHMPSRQGLTVESKAGPVWNGAVRFNREWLDQPLRFKRPRRIFVCAHGDLFAEGVPDAWIDQVFAVMALAPQHSFQVLTKRPARMRQYLSDPYLYDRMSVALGNMLDGDWIWNEGKRFRDRIEHLICVFLGQSTDDEGNIVHHDDPMPLPNVWLGGSCEDQRRADERREPMAALAANGWRSFVSYEPAIGPIDWTGWEFLSWLISGGENGPRPSHPDWHRASRDFCAAHGIPYFFKQWGTWFPQIDRERDDPDWRQDYSYRFADNDKTRWLNLAGGRGFHGERFHVMGRVGKKAAGRLLDGVEHSAFPRVAP